MHSRDLDQKLTDIVAPLVQSLGLTLWDLRYIPAGKNSILRIYVEKPGGVTVDQLAKASRHIGVVLDVEDVIPGSYNLEVSSPGLERPFFEPEQMQGYIGREVAVTLNAPIEGRKKFTGELVGIDGRTVIIKVDDEKQAIKWETVKKARLVHRFE